MWSFHNIYRVIIFNKSSTYWVGDSFCGGDNIKYWRTLLAARRKCNWIWDWIANSAAKTNFKRVETLARNILATSLYWINFIGTYRYYKYIHCIQFKIDNYYGLPIPTGNVYSKPFYTRKFWDIMNCWL